MRHQREARRAELRRRAEDERERHRQSNGHDQTRRSLPPIDQADVARWTDEEPRDIVFTIADLVPQGMVTLLTIQGGAGKTLLLQMAGVIVAAGGMTFLGKVAVTGKAAGVFAEDSETVLHVRQPRINEFLGIDYDRIAGRYFPQSYFGLSAQLWRKGESTPFLGELEDQLSRIEALRLTTLDNAAVLFAGDENSRSEVTEFTSLLNGLANRLGIGINLSAHASKSQDGTALRVTSGSTAWVNACRSVWSCGPATAVNGRHSSW
jgi:RecA-family ATPase